VFDIPSWNYTLNAARFGLGQSVSLPGNPTAVNFVLISAASDVPAAFQAGLQSLGAAIALSPGAVSSESYSGAVSTLETEFPLTAEVSQQIFGGPAAAGLATGLAAGATLTLRNLGPPLCWASLGLRWGRICS
jgi:hypothetical protein